MSTASQDLTGKTIVVVGASSGFGRGVALELATRGANVVLAARRLHLMQEMVRQIASGCGEALAMETDVCDPNDITRLREAAIAKFGHVDIWINNVGAPV